MRKTTYLLFAFLFLISGTLSAFADGRLQSAKAGNNGGDGPFYARGSESEFEIILDSTKIPDLVPGMKIKSVTFRGANDINNLKYTFSGYLGSTKSEAQYGEDLKPLAKPADAVDIQSTPITLAMEGDVEAYSGFNNTAVDLITLPVNYTYQGGNLVLHIATTGDAANQATSSSPKFTVTSSWNVKNCLIKYTASGYAVDWSRASNEPVVFLDIDGDVTSQPRTLTGKVTLYNSDPEVALSDVNVVITNANDTTIKQTVVTDADGKYTATLAAGIYNVLAVKDGYKADVDDWTYETPQADLTLGSTTLNLTMRKFYTLTLDPDSDNTAVISAAASSPANVTLNRSFSPNEFTTIVLPFQLNDKKIKEAFGDSTIVVGFSQFEILKDSTYLLTAHRDLNYDSTYTMYGNTPYVIKVGKKLDKVEFKDVNVQGLGWFGMGSSIYGKNWSNSVRMEGTYAPKETGANEYVLADTIFTRPATVKATMATFAPDINTTMIFDFEDHVYGDTAIHNQTKDTTVVEKKTYQLTGVVYLEGGDNAANATVTAVSTEDPSIVVATTADDEGTYSLDLVEGEYDVTASKDGYKSDTQHINIDSPAIQYFILKPDEATGISGIKSNATDVNSPVYTLDGVKIQNGVQGLKKGIYIINHRKFVVK